MAASPRPTFDKPTAIPYEQATRHVWGDAGSGQVLDWIYVSSSKIHQLVFALPTGGQFRHSDAHRTIFAADEVYYVLSGTLALANPESGEVQRVTAGEAAFFRRDTWHHGFNCGPEPLRGKGEVLAFWSRFYSGPAAPFSWEPDEVEVLDSGTLAHSSGPVRNAQGVLTSRFNSVWRREADGWRIVFDKGSPLQPARPGPAAAPQ